MNIEKRTAIRPSQVVLINDSFNDFGFFRSAVEHWDLDFMLLGKGGFKSSLHYSMINNCILGKAVFDCNLEQRGASPHGMRTFVIPTHDHVFYVWRNHQIDGNTIQLFPKNGELFSVSDRRFSCYVISFPESQFLAIANSMGYDLNAARWEQAFVWNGQDSMIRKLRRWCESYKKGLIDPDDTLLQLLIESLVRSESLKSTKSAHQKLVQLISDILGNQTSEILKIHHLVEATGYSERSIQYAFKSVLGISPMDYVKRKRMKEIYHELTRDVNQPIVDIANKFGFWHMGQFARDFKQIYGFLPSEYRKSAIEAVR